MVIFGQVNTSSILMSLKCSIHCQCYLSPPPKFDVFCCFPGVAVIKHSLRSDEEPSRVGIGGVSKNTYRIVTLIVFLSKNFILSNKGFCYFSCFILPPVIEGGITWTVGNDSCLLRFDDLRLLLDLFEDRLSRSKLSSSSPSSGPWSMKCRFGTWFWPIAVPAANW